jgi:hypothetical protein
MIIQITLTTVVLQITNTFHIYSQFPATLLHSIKHILYLLNIYLTKSYTI